MTSKIDEIIKMAMFDVSPGAMSSRITSGEEFRIAVIESGALTDILYQAVIDGVIGEDEEDDNDTIMYGIRNDLRYELREKWAEFCGRAGKE